MSKRHSIDLSEDRLLGMASDMIDDHNYITALKMLNKNAEVNYDSENSFQMYAEIFDDLSLYEKSVNYWYRFIDCTQYADCSDAYEGLAVDYMNLGEDRAAAYYYNKLLMETEDMTPEMRQDVIESFLSREHPHLRITYPPQLADYSRELSKGVDYMRSGDFDKAIEQFEEVQEGNPKYYAARNYIVMCNIISDKYDEAEQECMRILEHEPSNVQAITSLSAIKTEQHKTEESKTLAEKLVKLNVKQPEDLYKIATVCCENKMHREAYDIFKRLADDLGYDCNVMFFAAVSAWNCGEVQACFSMFDKLLVIYPNAFTARYYSDLVRDYYREGKHDELEYFYRLPQADREDMLSYLAAYASLPARASKKTEHVENVAECVSWAFDEGDHREMPELQYLAASCAVKAGLDGFIREMLLNAFLPDPLKVHVLSELCLQDSDSAYGVVICHMYKSVQCYPLKVGRAKRTNFKRAYSHLFARFAVVEERYAPILRDATVRVYGYMAQADKMKLSEDLHNLAAAIFYESGIDDAGIEKKNICSFFGADKDSYDEIIQCFKVQQSDKR